MAKVTKSGDQSKKGKPVSSPDSLVKTDKKSGIELTEDELAGVSGGAMVDYFLKIK